MIDVYVNGVGLSPADYNLVGTKLMFQTAPDLGDYISIQDHNGGFTILSGNGVQVVFDITHLFVLDPVKSLLDRVYDLRSNPTIAESLERLEVLVNLIE